MIFLCNSILLKFLPKPVVIKIYNNNRIISGCPFAKTSEPYRADSTKNPLIPIYLRPNNLIIIDIMKMSLVRTLLV